MAKVLSIQSQDANPLSREDQHQVPRTVPPPPSYSEIYPSSSGSTSYLSPNDAALKAPQSSQLSIEKSRSLSSASTDGESDLYQPPSSTSNSDDEILEQALNFASHPVPEQVRDLRQLDKPVAVPQVSPTLGMPFARGYSDVLRSHGITEQEFVDFIDHLNTISIGSPPLKLIDAAGGIIGMVPYHHCQWIGAGIQAGAKVTTSALSATRQKLYIKKSNEKFFAPRKLKVEVMKGKHFKQRLGLSEDFKLAVPYSGESADMSIHERRVASVAAYTAPMRWDVPEPSETSNILDKMNASAQKRQLAKQDRKAKKDGQKYAKKDVKRPRKTQKREGKRIKELEKLEQEKLKETRKRDKERAKVVREKGGKDKPEEVEKELAKIEREYQREIKKINKDIAKVEAEFEDELKKIDSDVEKEDKAGKKSGKCMWIVVSDLDQE